jgi:hypothetical protein
MPRNTRPFHIAGGGIGEFAALGLARKCCRSIVLEQARELGFTYHRIEDVQYARNGTTRDSTQARTRLPDP